MSNLRCNGDDKHFGREKSMKRLSAVLISAILLCTLAGCGSTSRKSSESKPTVETEPVASLNVDSAESISAEYKTVTDGNFPGKVAVEGLEASSCSGCYLISDGAYYTDGFSGTDRVSFVDFKTLNTFPLCSKPNCLHDDSNVCTAFGLSSGMNVSLCSYGGSIYYVENIREMSAKNGISTRADVYKANADGSGRKKVASADGVALGSLFVCGNKGYTVASEEILDENGIPTQEYNNYLESFDFETNELKNHGLLSHVYSSDSQGVIGEYGGKIYYMSVGAEQLPDGLEKTSPDYFDKLHALTVTRIFSLDPKTEEICESELPLPDNREGLRWSGPDIVAAAEGFYVCQQGDTAIIASPDGSLRKIENHRLSERAADYPVNGMMFNAETLLATELATGDIYKLKPGAIDENDSVIAYYNGEYIILGQFTRKFRKLSPDELFEKE